MRKRYARKSEKNPSELCILTLAFAHESDTKNIVCCQCRKDELFSQFRKLLGFQECRLNDGLLAYRGLDNFQWADLVRSG